MLIERHYDIEKDLRDLRRYSAPKDSLGAWERLFCVKGLKETPAIDRYPGFGSHSVYKARVIPLRENCGRSKGYRLIFEIEKKEDNELCIVMVFTRHGIYKNEHDLIRLIKARLL